MESLHGPARRPTPGTPAAARPGTGFAAGCPVREFGSPALVWAELLAVSCRFWWLPNPVCGALCGRWQLSCAGMSGWQKCTSSAAALAEARANDRRHGRLGAGARNGLAEQALVMQTNCRHFCGFLGPNTNRCGALGRAHSGPWRVKSAPPSQIFIYLLLVSVSFHGPARWDERAQARAPNNAPGGPPALILAVPGSRPRRQSPQSPVCTATVNIGPDISCSRG